MSEPGPPQFDPVTDARARARAKADVRRSAGRLEQEMLECQYGPVVNLSCSGMRIRCRSVPPSDLLAIVLRGPGEEIHLKARIAWKKRVGLFKYEVGMQFLDVDEPTGRRLSHLAMSGRMRRAM